MSPAESPRRRNPVSPSSAETPITLGQVVSLGDELEAIATDVLQGLQYSFVAAAAHPDVRLPFGSLEEAFQDAIALRPPERRWVYHSRARRIAMEPMAVRQAAFGRYGRLGAAEFARGGLAIAWRHLSTERFPARRLRTARLNLMPAVRPEVPTIAHFSRTTLALYITEVSCLDRTEEAAKGEEIAIAGLALDADGGVAKVERFLVRGDFEHGVRKEYGIPGRKFCEFRVPETPRDYPLTYGAIAFLDVADRAGFSEGLAWAWAKASPILREAVESRIASAEAGTVSQAAGWVIERFMRWLGEEFKDDVIPPGVAFASLHKGIVSGYSWHRTEVTGAPGQLSFVGQHGRYRVGGQWRVGRA